MSASGLVSDKFILGTELTESMFIHAVTYVEDVKNGWPYEYSSFLYYL